MQKTLLIAAVLLIVSIPAMGASSFLGGFSGNIITPDAVVTPAGTWELSYHMFTDVFAGDDDLSAFGGMYGLTPDLEVGVSFLSNSENDIALNGKYRIVAETADRPAVLVGVFDAASTVGFLNDNSTFYIVLSKNITPFASEVAGEPSRPLRLSLGAGSGIYDGFFAGFDWTLDPRLSLMAEFSNGSFGGDDSAFNVGARYAVTDMVRLDAGLIDFDNFAFGVSLRTTLQ